MKGWWGGGAVKVSLREQMEILCGITEKQRERLSIDDIIVYVNVQVGKKKKAAKFLYNL